MQTENQSSFSKEDHSDVASAARREIEDAKVRLSDAADRVKHEARHAGSTISTLVLDELDRRAADMGTQLRSVSDRLRGNAGADVADASPAMADHAADLIEDLSSRLQGQSIRDMGQRLGQFGRENPALFVMGCLLTGAMAGRMVLASGGTSATGGQSRGRGGSADQSRAQTGRDDAGKPARAFGDTPADNAGDAETTDQHIAGYGKATTEKSGGFPAGRPGSGNHD